VLLAIAPVIAGATVSSTLIVWIAVLEFPHASATV
jgi:hypothetical protein